MDEECELMEKCNNGQCMNPCQLEKACGLNALCRTENHIMQCSCPLRFTGNQDVECVRSKYIYAHFNQMYVKRIGQTKTLILNHVCDTNRVNVSVPRLCGAAGECENDHMCKDSMCVPQCKGDEECALNERCSKGACLRT